MAFYRPCLLDPGKHQREDLVSGEPSLDDWLHRYAGQSRRKNTAATWVIADADYRVICYACLSMTAVDRSRCPKPLAKGAPMLVPALLIGRLATDRFHTGLGLGTQMLRHILATAVELNIHAACMAVVVTALSGSVPTWWHRFGFEPFDSDDATNLDLYLLTKDIQATLQDL